MQHVEHISLIKKAISRNGGVWADSGSGEGAFTLALRDLETFSSVTPTHFVSNHFSPGLIAERLSRLLIKQTLS